MNIDKALRRQRTIYVQFGRVAELISTDGCNTHITLCPVYAVHYLCYNAVMRGNESGKTECKDASGLGNKYDTPTDNCHPQPHMYPRNHCPLIPSAKQRARIVRIIETSTRAPITEQIMITWVVVKKLFIHSRLEATLCF